LIIISVDRPRLFGYKKLSGNKELYHIRSGKYREVYQIQGKVLVVLNIRVLDRNEVYKES